MSSFGTYWAIKVPIILYIIFSIYYRTPIPLAWGYNDSFSYWIIIAFFSVPLLISAYVKRSSIDLNSKIDCAFELNSYKNSNQRLIDYILSHYTNVATVGLFLILVIYILKPYTKIVSPFLLIGLIVLLISVIFFIYSLLLIRLGFYFSNRSYGISVPVILVVTYIDFQAIDIFIRSTQK